ncbi:MAG: hypothetical protein KAS04_06360 [Candidatus Aenigmarchaeota archaeon]|nr:hypothetical protein [Candidatus Aenigmarchaeota archaeon]
MFNELRRLWSKEDLFTQAQKKTGEMLTKNEEIFLSVMGTVMNNKKMNIDIYKADKETNRYEIKIRKKIIEHLAINPRYDTVGSLVLLGIAKDIERIGDFSKNIYELSQIHNGNLSKSRYFTEIDDIGKNVIENFRLTSEALANFDKEKAKKVMDSHHKVLKKKADKVLKDLLSKGGKDQKTTLVCALLSRYLKRVDAHLANIASTMVNPFHRIRFQDTSDDTNIPKIKKKK